MEIFLTFVVIVMLLSYLPLYIPQKNAVMKIFKEVSATILTSFLSATH